MLVVTGGAGDLAAPVDGEPHINGSGVGVGIGGGTLGLHLRRHGGEETGVLAVRLILMEFEPRTGLMQTRQLWLSPTPW